MREYLTVASFLISVLFITSSAQAVNVTTVCSSGCNFISIQAAINNASPTDEIRIIDSREYNENIFVNVTGITLTSNATSRPTIWSNLPSPNNKTIHVLESGTTIERFNIIYNGSDNSTAAIVIQGSGNSVTIRNNTISNTGSGDSGYGITPHNSVGNTIVNNTINTDGGNGNVGIFFFGASPNSNNITGNIISTDGSGDNNYGIHLALGSNNDINNNQISTNGVDNNFGISLSSTSSNRLSGNIIITNGSNNNYGISVSSSSNSNSITGSTINTSGGGSNYGISIQGSISNTFSSSSITTYNSDTDYGVVFSGSSYDNVVSDSTINAVLAPDIRTESNFLGNFLINTTFNKSDISTNNVTQGTLYVQHRLDIRVENSSGQPISGAVIGGNDNGIGYAESNGTSNPTSSFSGTTNSSGYIPTKIITEFAANINYTLATGYLYFTNYTITANSSSYEDNITEINLTSSSELIIILQNDVTPPVITVQKPLNTTYVIANNIWFNLTLDEPSISNVFASFNGTNNVSMSNSTGNWNILVFPIKGSHYVIFYANDSAGNDAIPVTVFYTIDIQQQTTSSGGGGSSSSTSSSATVTQNTSKIIIKEEITLGTINPENVSKVKLSKPEIPVTELSISVNRGSSNVRISVTKVDTSNVISKLPGKVFSYIDIDKENIKDEDINETTINFRVENKWIEDNNATPSSVFLYRFFEGKWNKLNTSMLSSDSVYTNYEAKSPGFSSFAIAIDEFQGADVIEPVPEQVEIEHPEEPENYINNNIVNISIIMIIASIVGIVTYIIKKKKIQNYETIFYR